MKYVKSYGYLIIAMLLFQLPTQLLINPDFLPNQLPNLSEDLLLLTKGLLFCIGLFGSWLISDEALKNLEKI